MRFGRSLRRGSRYKPDILVLIQHQINVFDIDVDGLEPDSLVLH